MKNVDELRDTLERYSTRREPRGAAAVLADARGASPVHRPRHRYLSVAILAVACVIAVITIVVVRQSPDALNVDTTPHQPGALSTPPLPSLTVPDGTVQLVRAAFGRTWVATLDRTAGPYLSHLRSFDPATGALRSESAVAGLIGAFGVTDHYVWVRTSTGGPASFPIGIGGLGDNAIYRVDPGTGTATALRFLNGDGPLTTNGTRVAAADAAHIEIVDESGQQIASASIDKAVGISNATSPGTNAFLWLTYGPGGLYALHQGRAELIQLDPETARHVATHPLEAKTIYGLIAATGDRIWIEVQTGSLIAVAAPLSNGPLAPAQPASVQGRISQVDALNDHQVVVLSPSVVTVLDATTGVAVETNLDPTKQANTLVIQDQAWVAQWADAPPGPPTVVNFVAVAISRATSEADPTATDQPSAATGADELVARLSEAGAMVTRHGTSPGTPFQVDAQLLCVDNLIVHVYEYPDSSSARSQADAISEDGSTIGRGDGASSVEWIGSPHFFAQGRIIVLDLNGDARLLARLGDGLGPTITPRAVASNLSVEPCS